MLGKKAAGLVVGVLGLAAAQHAVAGKTPAKGGSLDRKPVSCVWLQQLRRTEIVNDKTVLFYMYDGTVYRNILKDRCFGLAHADALNYSVFSTPELCSTDMITPLEIGVPVPPIPCRLGPFVPIDPLEAKDTLAGPKDALAQQNEVQVKQVKLPPDDASSPAQAKRPASPADSAAASGQDAKTPPSAPAPPPDRSD